MTAATEVCPPCRGSGERDVDDHVEDCPVCRGSGAVGPSLARLWRIRTTIGKPALVGEAPSRGGDEYFKYPLSGPPARVLCRLAGIEPDECGTTYGRWYWPLRERFLATNLVERDADAEPWSAPRARERALGIVPQLPLVIVLLGVRVAAAFGMSRPFYEWDCMGGDRAVVCIPHPSGLNRLYNDPIQKSLAGECLREAVKRAENHILRDVK